MLKIAKEKAKQEKLDLQFIKGDMRIHHVGEFDAVITIFNSVGHLTKTDFEKAADCKIQTAAFFNNFYDFIVT